jgi:hypothetical protein
MFSKEALALYHSIQAPQSIMEAVDRKMEQSPRPKNKKKAPWVPTLVAAACLAIILSTGILSPKSESLLVNGNRITTNSVVVYDENTSRSAVAPASNSAFSLALALPENSENLSVSLGELQENKESVNNGRNFTWLIPSASDEATATLTFSIDEKTFSYTLHSDANGVWYMEQTSN